VASDLALLLASWELALRAERKSSQTVKAYGDGVRPVHDLGRGARPRRRAVVITDFRTIALVCCAVNS
jgi:hypothetical protein